MSFIKVWRFHEAPEKYRQLSEHGGDEDWLAFIPKDIWLSEYEWIGWMEDGTAFGCCDVSTHMVDGGVIRIGAHA